MNLNPLLELIEPLTDLDRWLKKTKIYISLDIIGGVAILLHDPVSGRATTDIDSHRKISQEVRNRVEQIGRERGIPDWLDCPDYPIPKDSKWEVPSINSSFDNIDIRILSLKDILHYKNSLLL